MSKVIISFLLISFSFGQNDLPSEAPLNPDFVKYMENKKLGKLNNQNSHGHYNGIVPHPTGRKVDISPNYKVNYSFPAKYDLRDLDYITPVRDQGDCGSCWIFATIGSIESYWKKIGLGNTDLSEQNLATENGFEGDPCDGGRAKKATPYFLRGDGPISESDDPYTLGKPMFAPQGVVTQARFLPNDMNVIKQCITDYGGLYSSFWWFGGFGDYYDSTNNTYFFSNTAEDTTDAGHAIVLVGWDDNMQTAGGTGAWIIKNSWDNSFGENGYFYISYQDVHLNIGNIACWPGRKAYDPNSTIYYYDELGWLSNVGYNDETAYALVKYVINGNETLTDIGTYINTSNTTVDFEIYNNFDGNTLSNKLTPTQSNNCDFPGYHSFPLQTSLTLLAGQEIFVKVKYSTPNYGYPVPFERYMEDYANPQIESGVFWISSTGNSWFAFGSDITDYERDPCVKLYTTRVNGTASQTIIDEGFDSATFPPTGWTQTVTNGTNTWQRGNPTENNFSTIDQNSQNSAICAYDDNAYQNEYIYSPVFSLASGTAALRFYAGHSTAWLSGATLSLWISTDSGQTWTQIWQADNDGQGWGWRKIDIDLSAYAGNQYLRLCWGYVGQGGDLVGLDGVRLISNGTVAIEKNNNKVETFRLEQNIPNPFNPTTTIGFHLPYESHVDIAIYDLMGRELIKLVYKTLLAGQHTIEWNGTDRFGQLVSGGLYFYKLEAGDFVDTKKLIFIK